MPYYFFNLCSPGVVEKDEDGLDLRDLDAAYLEAHRAVLSISSELLDARLDPYRHRFEICDEDGKLLLDLPFSEALRRGSRPVVSLQLSETALNSSRRRNAELRGIIVKQITQARSTLADVRATLRRSAEQDEVI